MTLLSDTSNIIISVVASALSIQSSGFLCTNTLNLQVWHIYREKPYLRVAAPFPQSSTRGRSTSLERYFINSPHPLHPCKSLLILMHDDLQLISWGHSRGDSYILGVLNESWVSFCFTDYVWICRRTIATFFPEWPWAAWSQALPAATMKCSWELVRLHAKINWKVLCFFVLEIGHLNSHVKSITDQMLVTLAQRGDSAAKLVHTCLNILIFVRQSLAFELKMKC